MISLKAFITAIHNAVFTASESLMDKNYELLTNYFTDVETTETGENAKNSSVKIEKHLHPKMVKLEYPNTDSSIADETTSVMVPLITLVPFSASQLEKVTFTTEFKIFVDQNDELQLDFSKINKWGDKHHVGKLEIVVSPTDTPEGLQRIIESYEAMLRRQI